MDSFLLASLDLNWAQSSAHFASSWDHLSSGRDHFPLKAVKGTYDLVHSFAFRFSLDHQDCSYPYYLAHLASCQILVDLIQDPYRDPYQLSLDPCPSREGLREVPFLLASCDWYEARVHPLDHFVAYFVGSSEACFSFSFSPARSPGVDSVYDPLLKELEQRSWSEQDQDPELFSNYISQLIGYLFNNSF